MHQQEHSEPVSVDQDLRPGRRYSRAATVDLVEQLGPDREQQAVIDAEIKAIEAEVRKSSRQALKLLKQYGLSAPVFILV